MIKKHFIRWFKKYLKAWGVEFQSNLPPEFIVTTHAEERIVQRIGCKKDKIAKLVMKAWSSQEKISEVFENRREYGRPGQKGIFYKQFMGYVFVFQVQYIQSHDYHRKKLITVYN